MSENTSSKPHTEDDEIIEVNDFDWLDFFERVNDKVTDKKFFSRVPDSAFQHVEESLDSGVKEGFVVEYLWNESKNLYWLAIIENIFGPLLKLSYVGEDKPTGEIWHDLSKKMLYPLGWCQMNKIDLEPPDHIKQVCVDWESLALKYLEDISYDTISMHHIEGDGVTPLERLKVGMVLDLQDSENPFHFWPVKIAENRGCLLSLEYLNFPGNHETLFYLSPKLFPKGYAQKSSKCKYALPSKLHGLATDSKAEKIDISKVDGRGVPVDLVSGKIPEKHKFEVGFHLEMIHPITSSSIERFVVESVVDNLYFIVQSVSDPTIKRATSLLDPTIFPCGTSRSLRSVSCTINDATTRGKVVQKRNFPELKSAEELGFVDRQKLEIYDGRIFRTATIVETRNHLLILSIDGTSTKSFLFKSAHSMDIFPLGWCFANGVPLHLPKSFFPDAPKVVEEPLHVPEEPAKADKQKQSTSSWCEKVYFNYKCYSASFISKARLASLPKSVGPGPVQLVTRTVLNLLIGSSFKSGSVLKRLELQEDSSPRPSFVVEEFKGKSRVLNLKANIQIPTKVDELDEFLREVCKKVGACPYLVSTRLYENVCPEDCHSKPKSEFEHPSQPNSKPQSVNGSKTKLCVGRKRKHPDTILAEKSGITSSTPSDESDITPAASRATSPVECRKRGRPSREAKLQERIRRREERQRLSAANKAKENEVKTQIEVPKTEPSIKTETQVSSLEYEDSESASESSDLEEEIFRSPPIRKIQLASNPEYWSPLDTAKFLAKTTDCNHLARLMLEDAIDGQAFLLLSYPTARHHWNLEPKTAVQLCQHVEAVRLAHLKSF